MKNFFILKNSGFTLMELIVVLAVLAIIGTVILGPLSFRRDEQSLSTSVETTLSVLSEARAKTLASENDTRYGVYLDGHSIFLFEGASYVDGAGTNKEYSFSGTAFVSTTSLASGTSTILFNRLSGETDNHGTITIGILNSTSTKQVKVEKTGFSSQE